MLPLSCIGPPPFYLHSHTHTSLLFPPCLSPGTHGTPHSLSLMSGFPAHDLAEGFSLMGERLIGALISGADLAHQRFAVDQGTPQKNNLSLSF